MRINKLISCSLVLIAASGCTPTDNSNQSGGANASVAGAVETEEGSSRVAVADGPFGYAMGQSIEKLGLEKMDKPGLYHTNSPPKPHADFESVVVEAYPDTGICRIRGVGRNIENDGSGGGVRTKVQELAEALATRYGEGRKVDRCGGGDIQCQSEFWMMTLNGGERYYGYEWSRQNEKMKAGKIGAIDVAANAADISTSYALVEYVSSNKTACDKARRNSSASSL